MGEWCLDKPGGMWDVTDSLMCGSDICVWLRVASRRDQPYAEWRVLRRDGQLLGSANYGYRSHQAAWDAGYEFVRRAMRERRWDEDTHGA